MEPPLHENPTPTQLEGLLDLAKNLLVAVNVAALFSRAPVERAKVADRGANIRVVDVAVHDIGHHTVRVKRLPKVIGKLEQVRRGLVDQGNPLLVLDAPHRGRCPRCSKATQHRQLFRGHCGPLPDVDLISHHTHRGIVTGLSTRNKVRSPVRESNTLLLPTAGDTLNPVQLLPQNLTLGLAVLCAAALCAVGPSNAIAEERAQEPRTYTFLRERKLSGKARRKLEKMGQAIQKVATGVEWRRRHRISTEHFTIHSNVARKTAKKYAAQMEAIRAKLSELFPGEVRRDKAHQTARTPVFIFRNREEFLGQRAVAEDFVSDMGGYYDPATGAITTYHGRLGSTTTTFHVLCHEALHYYQGLVVKDINNIPPWLTEGLAVYFGDGSVFHPKRNEIEVGRIPYERLAHIQTKVLRRTHTPVHELIRLTATDMQGSQYADAWALVYFLINSGSEGRAFIEAYWTRGLGRRLETMDFVQLAKRHFGGLAAIERHYVDYIRKLELPAAGKVLGDYFVSPMFQFFLRSPTPDWRFFADKLDRRMLVGILSPDRTAEVRIYLEEHPANSGNEPHLRESRPRDSSRSYLVAPLGKTLSMECSSVRGELEKFASAFDRARQGFQPLTP